MHPAGPGHCLVTRGVGRKTGFVQAIHLLDDTARREGAACAGEAQHRDLIVVDGCRNPGQQPVELVTVDGVEHLGAIHRGPGHHAPPRFHIHASAPAVNLA